jgi:SM-20-related protein
MVDPSGHHWIDDAVAALADRGFYFGRKVFGTLDILDILARIQALDVAGAFTDAGVGRSGRHQINQLVRGDRVRWVDEKPTAPLEIRLMDLMAGVRQKLNQELFAGLVDFEGHFAIYPPGGFYHRHVDSFRDDDSRVITFILYLNQDWRSDDGGQLRVYHHDGSVLDIDPESGSVVMFKSRDFPHEVLTARRERRSFTGWFRVRRAPHQ